MDAMRLPLTLNLTEAAELLKVHPDTLRRKAHDGKVPAAKFGRCWVFASSILLEWMNNQCRSTVEKAPSTGGYPSRSLASRLDKALEQKTEAKPKNLKHASVNGSGEFTN